MLNGAEWKGVLCVWFPALVGWLLLASGLKFGSQRRVQSLDASFALTMGPAPERGSSSAPGPSGTGAGRIASKGNYWCIVNEGGEEG